MNIVIQLIADCIAYWLPINLVNVPLDCHLKIDPVWIVGICVCVRVCVCVCVSACVCICVCLPPKLLITSGMTCSPYDWLNQLYSCYMATVAIIINERGFGINTCHRN